MGIADSYGVELRHPIRDGRRAGQIGRNGISNQRRIVGGKFCAVVNRFGLICDWGCAGANVHDQTFHLLLRRYDGRMVVLADRGFHRAARDPANVMICRRGQWECADEGGDGAFNAECEVWFQGAASSRVGRF